MKRIKIYSPNFKTSVLFIFLSTIVIILYFRTFGYDFVNFDDEAYIHKNFEFLTQSFIETVKWSFSSLEMSNWHPLTWLSYSLDCHLFGYNAGGSHFINVLLHIANTMVLFIFLRTATGAFWKSAFITALFAVHPIQVESVAWISERKNLLSTFFGLLSMIWYVKYARKENLRLSYFLCLMFLILSLLSKPMLVTMPFIFMLLDYWPLCRYSGKGMKDIIRGIISYLPEKIPFFIIILGSCVITVIAQHSGGAIADLKYLPFSVRLANISISYAEYIHKLLLPDALSVIYVFPAQISITKAAAAFSVLFFTIFLVITRGCRQPYLPVGWFWLLGTLAPVIGIVQVGVQSMADRYMYVPCIGLFIVFVFLFSHLIGLAGKTAFKSFITITMVIITLFSFSYATWGQVLVWKDSEALFSHAIAVDDRNFRAHNSLGAALMKKGTVEEGIKHIKCALEYSPDYDLANLNLGKYYFDKGDYENARECLIKIVTLNGGHVFAPTYNLMGIISVKSGNYELAESYFLKALEKEPNYDIAKKNLELLAKERRDSFID